MKWRPRSGTGPSPLHRIQSGKNFSGRCHGIGRPWRLTRERICQKLCAVRPLRRCRRRFRSVRGAMTAKVAASPSQSGGIGRRAGFKIPCPQGRVGSIPTSGTSVDWISRWPVLAVAAMFRAVTSFPRAATAGSMLARQVLADRTGCSTLSAAAGWQPLSRRRPGWKISRRTDHVCTRWGLCVVV